MVIVNHGILKPWQPCTARLDHHLTCSLNNINTDIKLVSGKLKNKLPFTSLIFMLACRTSTL
jgi:hypothetical protein